MKDRLFRLDRACCAAAAVLLAIFLLLLYCNLHTALVADDYQYCFSFADGSRITSVGQIPASMAAHRHIMNGRVFPHALVQLFLLLPKGIFNVFNALAFTALVCLLARPCRTGDRRSALLLLAVFGCVWVLQPEFGQVFLWLDGSLNYLWCAVLSLMWLRPWADCFLTGREPGRAGQLAFVLCSFFVGAWSENGSVALVFMALLFLALGFFREKKAPRPWQLASLAVFLAGFLYMMLAPATAANKAAEMKLSVLLGNFAETGLFYLRFWPLLLSFAMFYALALRKSVAEQRRLLALVYLGGSLAGHFVLSFALYCAGRSTCIGLALLIAANALLLGALIEDGWPRLPAALCALCLLFTVYWVAVGVQDILRTDWLLDYNVELIEECLANGERDIQIPRPYARTKYSALEGLGYLSTEDLGEWYNVYMARYYGADSLLGY
ncbi:MAG: DUF6056 family protein [Oscillospiraceae bacterium]|nr:DUF6056 family protein [Oscillospiraceae bacterium]